MRIFFALALAALTATAFAEEAASSSSAGTAGVVAGIVAAIVAIVVPLLFKLLGKSKPEAAPEMPADLKLDEARNFFIDKRLIPFLVSTAEHWLITQLPAIVADATDGNGFDWKQHWTELRAYLKQRAVDKFAAENRDLVKFLGSSRELDDIIDRQVAKLLAKLPDAVKALLPQSAVDMLVDKAKAFLVAKADDLLTPKA